MSILFGIIAPVLPIVAKASTAADDPDSVIIEESDIPLELWYDEEAPKINELASHPFYDGKEDDGWQQYSLPIGNGYFGASVFGRTYTERIQITEKTLGNPYKNISGSDKNVSYGGLNNFSETYIDFGHINSAVSGYKRYLDMKTAISGVEYTYDNVKYTREYFATYEDKALVIKLDADTVGKLSFTLRPTVPYEQEYMAVEGDGMGKTGEVTSSVKNGVGYIELSGKLQYYDVDFLGMYKVYTDGGTIEASTVTNDDGDTDGTIVVSGANSAYIVVTLGTDYEISSEIFSTSDANKPTKKTTLADTRVKVEGYMSAVDAIIEGSNSLNDAYNTLKSRHVADHYELFGRVTLDLECNPADFGKTTDKLLEEYKNGYKSTYLEVLLFQYGRYQLIASSREGALPANLQGVWNPYNTAPWSCGYWHNINVQMNYWPAFSTNLAETFQAYVDYNNAFMEAAEEKADYYIGLYFPEKDGLDGGNGWTIGIGQQQFNITGDRSAGNLGFTTQMFWEYYQYTKDETVLTEIVLSKLLSAARFITKCVEPDENGNYLVDYCDSPEMFVDGVWYYTKGTTYAQTFAYLNNYHVLELAKEAGIGVNEETGLYEGEYAVLNTILEQLDKYDPINVGFSGQIKEFREEDYYCSIGDEPNHRHISQLVGLYPGNIINSTTPAWIDAALVTLENRGGNTTGGWVYAHKTALYARAKDGDEARQRIDELLSRATFPNLFTRLQEVYQFEASAGVTAGIAEMLLQSNAGYIEPLAAIPSSWATGSYTGLCAEGNFDVSAAWENGTAKTLNILSKSGGVVSVAYPSITGARVVRKSDGKTVDYTVNAADRISFNTEVGETYIISGFKAQEKIEAPETISYTREEKFGVFTLDWEPVDGAIAYNLYVAVENASDYTLVTTTDKTEAIYIPNDDELNARTTFAVTAVGAKGTESKRTLCYYVPEDVSASIVKVSASVDESGKLQVLVNANENTGKYKLYEKTPDSSDYTLVTESGFPILYYDGYKETSKYAVSVVSYFTGEESALSSVGSYANSPLLYNAANIFEGKTFEAVTGTGYLTYDGYGIDKLTDGIIDNVNYQNGRFAVQTRNKVDATIDLQGTYVLSELRFHVFEKQTSQAGTNFTVQVYSDGKWISVVENVSNADIVNNYCQTLDTGIAFSFDLGLIKGSKIRIYAESVTGTGITFCEAECAGIMLDSKYCYSDNILLGKEFVSSYPTIYHEGAGGDVFTYEKLTDGIISSDWKTGRYSSTGGANVKFYGTVDLGGLYKLDKLRIYDFEKKIANAGNDLKIEIYYGGEWIEKYLIANNADVAAYRVTAGTGVGKAWLEFDLSNTLAEKIRVSSTPISGSCVTLYEIECSGTMLYNKKLAYSDNVFLGKEFTSSEPVTTASDGTVFSYAKLTDGIVSSTWNIGRYASQGSAEKGKMDGIIDLEGVYQLDRIKFYDFEHKHQNAGNLFKIELYFDGAWKTAVYIENNADLAAYRVTAGSGVADSWLEFDLEGAFAEKVRISSSTLAGKTVTFNEIECSGVMCSTPQIEDNVFADKEFVSSEPVTITSDGTAFSYAKLTDGIISSTWNVGRYASQGSVEKGKMDGIIDLDGVYQLTRIRFYDFEHKHQNAGNLFKIEIYFDGAWRTAVYIENNDDLAAYRVTVGSGVTDSWLEFDLGGAFAEKVRVSSSTLTGKTVTFNEIECTGVKVPSDNLENEESNAFKSASSTLTGGTEGSNNPISNVFDGKLDTYAEVKNTASYSITVDLEASQILYTLKIYELVESANLINGALATASDDTTVEIYRDGAWVRVVEKISLDPNGYTEISLYGTECSKVRITFKNTRLFDGESAIRGAKIREIACTSANNIYVDRSAMLEAYEKLARLQRADKDYAEKMEEFKADLTDLTLTQEGVDGCVAEMNAYYEAVKNNVISYVPKTSVTLGSELSINVYIPTKNLQKFTLDGVSYENLEILNDKKVVLANGEECYKMTVLLPVSEAGREIKLTAYVSSEEANATVTFTISIAKYSTKAIEKGTDVEKTLIRDVLSYIRAGYVFFEKDASVISTIDSIIGANYDNTSPYTPEGSSVVPSIFKAATFNLDSTPAVRFYLNDGENAENCSFKIGGATKSFITNTDSRGTFVEISVYAYAMCEAVECYYDGAYVGSYHIASYYDWAVKEGDAELISLVERFWKYCQSARDYKNSVTVQINYVDEAGNKMAESHVNRYKTGESISVLSPSVDGYYTRDVYVMETVNSENNVFNVVYKLIPSNIDSDAVDKYLSDVVAWGDSITAGAGYNELTAVNQYGIDLEALGSTKDGANYVTVLKNLITKNIYAGIDVAGLGVGGEATSTIASRADTETYYLYLDSAISISTGAVVVPLTHYASTGRTGILRQGGYTHVNPVTIVGKDESGNEISVKGTLALALTDDAPSGTNIMTCDAKYLKYTFTRTDGGTNTLSFVSGARVVTASSYLYDGRTCIIFMGENGGYSSTDELIKQQEEILKACGNPEYYLIISTTSGSYESRTALREALTQRWGDHYINMGDELNSTRKSYELAGYSEEAILSVLGNIADGTVSSLLIKDTCHPNAVGYAVIGNVIFERLFKLGAFDELFDYYDRLYTVSSSPLTKEDFSGKTITFLGDSITYGVGASSTANRYSSQVAASLGMTEINMGISGTVMCTGGHRTSRLGDIQKISLDSDYVGILLGINDFDQCRNDGTSNYYALGEFGTSDTTTIYGALDKMCKDLVARFGSTDTKVFLMTPVITSWNNSVSGTRDWDQSKANACGYTLRELCDAIVEVATYYGIVTLDLNTECEMSAADFSDGIHPNDSGAKKIADTIEAFLLANYSLG